MSYKDIIKNQLPNGLYKDNGISGKELNVLGNALDDIQDEINKLEIELIVPTATNEGLKKSEFLIDIPTDLDLAIEQRRSIIIGKLRGQGTITKEAIIQIAKSYINEVEVIESYSNYNFTVELNSSNGFPYKLTRLYETIEDVQPAHLGSRFKLISTTSHTNYFGTGSVLGEKTTIYPYTPRSIESVGNINIATSINQSADTTTVYPKGVI